MILNKFRPLSLFHFTKVLSVQVLALSLLCCNKSANINANKSFIAVTHVANNIGPVTVSLDGTQLFADPLAYGFTTGDTLNPYDTAVSRVSDMIIKQDTTTLLNGNSIFQQGLYYSAFVYYDTAMTTSASIIIMQNNPKYRSDTTVNIRYMNFSPSSAWGIKLINTRNRKIRVDTVNIAINPFVGRNNNPSSTVYNFTGLRIGSYIAYAYKDSANPKFDSSNFKKLGPLFIDSLTNYYIYLQGFTGTDTGVNKFQLKSIRLN